MAANAAAYERFAKDPQAFVAAVDESAGASPRWPGRGGVQKFAGDAKAVANLQANAQVFNAIAQNHAAFNALGGQLAAARGGDQRRCASCQLAANARCVPRRRAAMLQGLAAAARGRQRVHLAGDGCGNMAAQGRINAR